MRLHRRLRLGQNVHVDTENGQQPQRLQLAHYVYSRHLRVENADSLLKQGMQELRSVLVHRQRKPAWMHPDDNVQRRTESIGIG